MRQKNAAIIFSAVLLFICAGVSPAQATVMGVYPGDLIKLQNDHDPKTQEDEVVYYYDKDWFRRPFPNRKVYLSWYKDFSGVKELTKEQMAEIRLGGNIVYRPGTRLVKVPSIPKVYAVEPGGVLRWMETEAVAKALYGNDWAKRVDDVPESFFVNYREGAPLTTAAWPTGTFLRRASDATLFFIDGGAKRRIPPLTAAAYRVNEDFVVSANSSLEEYASGSEPAAEDLRFQDTGQLDVIETLPPPQVDFPLDPGKVLAGQEQTLMSVRITAGDPVKVKGLRVSLRLDRPLWSGATPGLTDLKFVDASGTDLFGTQQLSKPGSSQEDLVMSGSYFIPESTTRVIDLRAKVSAALTKGARLTLSMNRSDLSLADGGSDEALPNFFPGGPFPVFTLVVE